MADWKEYKIGELVRTANTGLDAIKRAPIVSYDSGIKCLRIQDISQSKSFQNWGFCDVTDNNFKKFQLKKGDIILARTGATIGVNTIIKEDLNSVFNNGLIRIRVNSSYIIPEYLSYHFQSSIYKSFIESISGGTSTQPNMQINALLGFEIKVPPLDEQRAITEILSSLDAKIDLLHSQNKTLEALAETLFRQWFVEEAEEDWETTNLFNIVELIGGGTPKTEVADYWDGDIKWISAKDITPNHKKFIVDTEKRITEKGLKNSSARLLPKYATVISARGTVGNYCILSESMTFSQSNYGIKPKFKDCYFFTYLLIANAVEELQSAAYGSVFDTITTSTFKEHQIKIPTEKEIQIFEEKVKPYFEKMFSNEIQIRSLTALRDTLLPKLMSGDEVRVNF
jgi:type I restriction enzyme S subunit